MNCPTCDGPPVSIFNLWDGTFALWCGAGHRWLVAGFARIAEMRVRGN